MKIQCKNYKIRTINNEDYIEVTLDITTLFPKGDLENIKLYCNEMIEDTKAFCGSPSSNQLLKFHYLTRSIYKFAFPSILYGTYKLYKRLTCNKLAIPSYSFQKKLGIRLFGMSKSLIFLLPSLFCAGVFLEYSNRLPLLYVQDNLNKTCPKNSNEKFKNYLLFKQKINRMRYGI